MAVERKDPNQICVLGGEPGDAERFIESDFRIRSGQRRKISYRPVQIAG